MAGKTSKLMVGLFVALGVILTVVAIIWVGATKYFEKGNLFVTYFDESVQGLQKDSTVKYRGVEVGRVEQIRVAPDNRLIAVIMKINLKEDLPKTVISQLKVAGITGLVFVELDRQQKGEAEKSPKISFPSEYPIIPSRPSEIAKIMGGVTAVVDKFSAMDTRGIFDSVKSAVAQIEIFFRGKDMETIIANVKTLTGYLKDSSKRIDELIAAGKLEEILAEAHKTLQESKKLMAAVQEEMKGLDLRETLRQTRSIAGEIKGTSENLRQTSETLEAFADRIKDRPPDLLFGKPPKKRFNE